MTKWVAEIDSPERMPEFVARAFHVALSGRPGPVVLALPRDVLNARVAVDNIPATSRIETAPGPSDMDRLQTPGGPSWWWAAAVGTKPRARRFTASPNGSGCPS